MARLTDEEIELWYEEEKQKLSDRYIACINKGMRLDRRQKKFDKAMEKLNVQYDRKHTKLLAQKESDKRSKKRRAGLSRPFIACWMAISAVFAYFGGGIAKAFKSNWVVVKFHATIVWIRNGYKLTDGFRSMIRPLFYFYIKYLQVPVIIITSPFIKSGRWVKKKTGQAKDSLKSALSSAGKAIAKSVKSIAKKSSSVVKWLVAKHEERAKRYHEWYSAKVQDRLDRKQKRKEEKEKRRKAKAGIMDERPAEGQAVAAPDQAPDANAVA